MNMRLSNVLSTFLLGAVPAMLLAQQAERIEVPLPPTLDVPAVSSHKQNRGKVESDEVTQDQDAHPGVRVHRDEQATVYEHRRYSEFYRAEVEPKYGLRYIFEDTDNDGSLNDGFSDPYSQDSQMWSIHNW